MGAYAGFMIMTAKQVARLFGEDKSVGAIHRMTQRGQLPHRKVGRRTYFLEHEVVAFIEAADGLTLEQALNRVRRAKGDR